MVDHWKANLARRHDRPYLFGKPEYFSAALAAQRGEKDRAAALLREGLVRGFSKGMLAVSYWAHRSPELAPLFGYAPFEELVKPKR